MLFYFQNLIKIIGVEFFSNKLYGLDGLGSTQSLIFFMMI